MSTFSGTKYDASAYLAHRPVYPESLYLYLREYIGLSGDEKINVAADVACGSGQASLPLAEILAQKVVGVDMSDIMLAKAKERLEMVAVQNPGLSKRISFECSDDRSLNDLFRPHSLDLITVAEAAHWFEYPQFWHNCHNLLKQGGVLAFWGYFRFSFEGYPESNDVIKEFGESDNKCGPYWDKGHKQLRDLYRDLKLPSELFTKEVRIVSESDDFEHTGPFELRRANASVRDMVDLLKTYSAYHNYKKENPNGVDILDETIDELLQKTGLNLDSQVNVKWETVLVCGTAK